MIDDLQPKLSNRQIAERNVQRFKDWIAERDAAGDWNDYVRSNKLNRAEIANECGFARSVLQQNPTVKAELELVEVRLRGQGVLMASPTSVSASSGSMEGAANDAQARSGLRSEDPAVQMALRRAMDAKAKAETRVKALEEQNATLRAEIRDLREQVKKLNFLDGHLCVSGRLLHP